MTQVPGQRPPLPIPRLPPSSGRLLWGLPAYPPRPCSHCPTRCPRGNSGPVVGLQPNDPASPQMQSRPDVLLRCGGSRSDRLRGPFCCGQAVSCGGGNTGGGPHDPVSPLRAKQELPGPGPPRPGSVGSAWRAGACPPCGPGMGAAPRPLGKAPHPPPVGPAGLHTLHAQHGTTGPLLPWEDGLPSAPERSQAPSLQSNRASEMSQSKSGTGTRPVGGVSSGTL